MQRHYQVPRSRSQRRRPKADSKGGGKGKEGGKQQSKAALPKSQAPTPKPKAKPKAEATATQDRSSVPCLSYPNGTCSRGESCPFFHDPKAKPAAKPKATAATSSAKATVAVHKGYREPQQRHRPHKLMLRAVWGCEVLQASLRAFARPLTWHWHPCLRALVNHSCLHPVQLCGHPLQFCHMTVV